MSLIPLSIFGLDYLKLLSIKSSLCILNTDLLLLYDWKYILSVCGLCFQPLLREVCRTLLWTAETVNTSLAGKKKNIIHGLCFWSQRDLIYLHYSSLLLCVQPYIPLLFPASNVFTVSIVQSSYMFCDKWLCASLCESVLTVLKWLFSFSALKYSVCFTTCQTQHRIKQTQNVPRRFWVPLSKLK